MGFVAQSVAQVAVGPQWIEPAVEALTPEPLGTADEVVGLHRTAIWLPPNSTDLVGGLDQHPGHHPEAPRGGAAADTAGGGGGAGGGGVGGGLTLFGRFGVTRTLPGPALFFRQSGTTTFSGGVPSPFFMFSDRVWTARKCAALVAADDFGERGGSWHF